MSRGLVLLLNGPLGIGKTTLGEALGEAIPGSVRLDGDALAALNPPPADETAYLHATIALLVGHHFAAGYRTFVVNHFWPTPAAIADLSTRLRAAVPELRIKCVRLTLAEAENRRRIAARQSARALNESDFEARTFAEERATFAADLSDQLGAPFDVSDAPEVLAARLIEQFTL